MEFEVEEVYKWIDSYPIARPKKNINRDFSDAVPLAEILKYHFPKLVDLHNYSPMNSFAQKLNNWLTLNRKVLKKLGLGLTNETMELLAKAYPGVIERVLFDVKMRIDSKSTQARNDDIYFIEGLPKEPGAILPVKVRAGSAISDQKIVPQDLFDKMQNDIIEKDELITTLQNKVKHMENVLLIKNLLIKDLEKKINKFDNQTPLRSYLEALEQAYKEMNAEESGEL